MNPKRTIALVLMLLIVPGGIHAADDTNTDSDIATWSESATTQLEQLSAATEVWQGTPPDESTIVDAQNAIADMRARAQQCVTEFSAHLDAVDQRIAALGEADDDAAAELQKARETFTDERHSIERQLARCRLITLRALEVLDTIRKQRRDVLSRQLKNRADPAWGVAADIIVNGLGDEPARKLQFAAWPALGIGALILSVTLPLMLMLGRALQRGAPRDDGDPESPPQRREILAAMYSRRTPWLAIMLAIGASLYIAGAAPLAAVVGALMISTLLAPLVQLFVCQSGLRCAEGKPARLLTDLVLGAGALLIVDAEQYLPSEAYLLLRAAFLLILVVLALWLLIRLSRRADFEMLRGLRLPIALALLAGPLADWLGYHDLGSFLTLGVYGSGAGILLVWLLLSAIGHVLDQLRDTEDDSPSGLRQWLGYKTGENVAGLGILSWLIRIAALVGLGYWLLFSWQVSETETTWLREIVYVGFTVGDVRIVPTKLLLAVFAFVVLLALARWLRRQLGERWLTRTSLDSGARQSIVSLTSYTIVGVAFLLALSMAGLDFQNLAIVAGALSVGIGFGLQNIVNNFVSGLILLFERPVRPGDWVDVNGTQGYVRRISIRYTLIQTFERAEVLVPNSELISNQVTNLMLSDTFGRVTIPIGVAYGSDTRLVRDILNRVAREHPMVAVYDPRVSPPVVFFIGFGDSSLDFELRFFIQNIDYKLSVRSDILFAIDDAFREAGIDIPFPQRVIHAPLAKPGVNNDETDQPSPD